MNLKPVKPVSDQYAVHETPAPLDFQNCYGSE